MRRELRVRGVATVKKKVLCTKLRKEVLTKPRTNGLGLSKNGNRFIRQVFDIKVNL